PVFNTTLQKSGQRVMITPLLLTAAENPVRAKTLGEVLGDKQGSLDLSIWTAARLAASFPYVSPAARAMSENGEMLKFGQHRLLDGGYSDNQGIASALDCLNELVKAGSQKFKKIAILEADPFPAGEVDSVAGPSLGGADWLVQLFGPPQTAIRALFRTQKDRNKREIRSFADQAQPIQVESFRFAPSQDCPAPLSWHLTQDERKKLQDGWHKGNNPKILEELVQFLE
ncbi:MAG: hypothetical protein V3T83_20235, partial [Acidobacteriota bacterium]